MSSGYGVGSSLLEIKRYGNEFTARERWHSNQMKAKFANPVEYGGKVYGLDDGIRPASTRKPANAAGRPAATATAKPCWSATRMLLLAENGEMVLIAPDPAELRELGRFPALGGKSWNTFALSGGKLLVRNHQEAACFERPLR